MPDGLQLPQHPVFSDIFSTFTNEKVGITDIFANGKCFVIIGEPGTGISAILKYVAQQAALEEIPTLKADIKLVILLEDNRHIENTSMSITDVVLGSHVSPSLSPDEKDDLFEWMKHNDDKILFVFDCCESIDEEKNIAPAFVKTLFPKSKILTSVKYGYFPHNYDYEHTNIYELKQLSMENVDILISEMTSQDLLTYLKVKKLSLYYHCSNISHLISILFTHVRNPKSPPGTLSDVMILMLHILANTYSDMDKHENTFSFTKRLTDIAFDKVVMLRYPNISALKTEDLYKYGLNDNHLNLFKNLNIACILEGSLNMFLSHSHLQDLLAAIHCLMLSVSEFKKILSENYVHKWFHSFSVMLYTTF